MIFRFLLACSMTLAMNSTSEVRAQQAPDFEDVISLTGVSNPRISPDGRHIAFQKRSTDWKNNRYDTEIWLSKDGKKPFQLTNHKDGSSSGPKWSPDGEWIAFTSSRGESNQIYVIRIAGGEAIQVTNSKQGIFGIDWSPDGTQLSFIQNEDRSSEDKKRTEAYGSFAVEDEEYSLNQLWVIDFDPGSFHQTVLPKHEKDSLYQDRFEARQILDSVDFSVNGYKWSPDGKSIAFGHQPDPLINSFFKSDISILNVQSGEHRLLVDNPSNDFLIGWSPDSQHLLFGSSLQDTTSNYYLNRQLFKIRQDGSDLLRLAANFDENIGGITWNENGIFGVAYQKTKRYLLQIDSDGGSSSFLSGFPDRVNSFTFSKSGSQLAFTASDDNSLSEVFKTDYPGIAPIQITNSTHQLSEWSVSDSEVISWKSHDGTTIEGVLHKPQDYDPEIKYPLMVIIHGGPTGISTPSPAPSYVYPIVQWLNKGALVLQPNYRGSAGYGEAFRSLNVRNLGVGDAWDVISGVDHLQEEGLIDGEKVAAMGWSQGGYISAFLTTSSDRFKAISVGAGISNWMTYYVNTDIHPFTRQYLKATPWSDQEIYEFTSPMTHINNASTPTLIQHGEFDRRVPPANAFELYQGLQDLNVPSKLIIYKGFGHGINKPKERLAAVWHNWQWFGKYIWGEEIEIPEE